MTGARKGKGEGESGERVSVLSRDEKDWDEIRASQSLLVQHTGSFCERPHGGYKQSKVLLLYVKRVYDFQISNK